MTEAPQTRGLWATKVGAKIEAAVSSDPNCVIQVVNGATSKGYSIVKLAEATITQSPP